jgi:hypothetical protein
MEIVVRHPRGEPAVVRMPSYSSVADVTEAVEIARKRNEIAELNEKAVIHMRGAAQAAGDLVKIADQTSIELVKLGGDLADAVATNELNAELRETRKHTTRAMTEKAMHDAVAERNIAEAKAKGSEFEATAIVEGARKKFAVEPPPDPKVAAEEKSRAEQEAETKEWATNVVLDVASWVYPEEDEDGYYAYAACNYYGPRLDEGKSHAEAFDIAREQLVRRKELRGPFPEKEKKAIEFRAMGMWTSWKKGKLEEKVAAEQRLTAEKTKDALEAARLQREAAEIVHRTVNGREDDEDFDTTK